MKIVTSRSEAAKSAVLNESCLTEMSITSRQSCIFI